MLSFHVKFVQTDRRTDVQMVGQTDRRTDRQTDNDKIISPHPHPRSFDKGA